MFAFTDSIVITEKVAHKTEFTFKELISLSSLRVEEDPSMEKLNMPNGRCLINFVRARQKFLFPKRAQNIHSGD